MHAETFAASSALGAAKKATDVLDRSGITAVADDSGIEDGTRAATSSYNTEEMAVSALSQHRDIGSRGLSEYR
jgi:Flp pilus assembly protein TadG